MNGPALLPAASDLLVCSEAVQERLQPDWVFASRPYAEVTVCVHARVCVCVCVCVSCVCVSCVCVRMCLLHVCVRV